jgi:hypothetical protein
MTIININGEVYYDDMYTEEKDNVVINYIASDEFIEEVIDKYEKVDHYENKI